ncbi:hypothetical protein EBZ39_16225, partial [bacterium]|nr:hypothetical protein [bacterium]
TQKDKVGDWDEFAQTFCPFDLADLGEEFDEVFDNDVMISLDAFEEVNPAHVWTVIDGDDGELYLAEGFHYVNRLGYVLCRAPRQPNKDFSTNHYKVYTYSK